jgi:hypothetical protein
MATVTATAAERITIIDENLQWGYARVPRPVLKARGLSDRAKCIYNLLLDYAWQQESCFPSQETLAFDLDTSVDTIQRGLQELKEYGLIDWKRQGFNRTNTYSILRLSECEKLRMVQPEPLKPDTADLRSQTPQTCGIQKPQNCGSNKTKSKETQESDEDSSKNSQKEKDETTATCSQMEHGAIRNPNEPETTEQNSTQQTDPCPSASRNPVSTAHPDPSTSHQAGESKNEASAFGGKTRLRQSFGKTQQQEKPPIGFAQPLKPLTQDEIDEKKRKGLNASGYTPLPGLIPPDQWQQLEQQVRQAPVKSTATHFHVCTKNAPLMIDTTLEQFTHVLGDDQANTAININRAAKLYRQSGLSEEAFREMLYEAFDQARRYCSANIKKKRPDGRPNRMPVFFAILQERLAV